MRVALLLTIFLTVAIFVAVYGTKKILKKRMNQKHILQLEKENSELDQMINRIQAPPKPKHNSYWR